MKLTFVGLAGLLCGFAAAAQPNFEPTGPSTRRSPITISEIMYKPADREDGRNIEFVELYNSNPWPEDVGGFRLAGDVDFVIPKGTKISAQGYLVIAANPADIQAVYGLSTALGPYTGSLKTSGDLLMHDEQDSILLELEYDDIFPWPAGAAGTGHSIVLARASYGEGDPRAWERGELMGGSPGAGEVLVVNGLRNVVINEILAHTDPPLLDSIELYNHSNAAVDLSGTTLSDEASTNKFTIPPGTVIPARGFVSYTETELGFALDATGETIYFKDPAGTQVLDALRFRAQENGVSFGRFPNGANDWYRLNDRSFGADNDEPLISDVGFNEIMYHPLKGGDARQYVELLNHGQSLLDLSGWKLGGGINFTFPPGASIAAGSYLVVGRDAAVLMASYPQLNGANTHGNFSGRLSGNGERITLTMPDEIVSTNSVGVEVTHFVDIVVDEVNYGTGGRWGRWSDGGGSSLELIDPRTNKRLAFNWADSDESGKAPWTTIEATGVLDNGAGSFSPLQVGLLDAGEFLVDEIEAINDSGVDGVQNGGFESGTESHSFVGSHSRSNLEPNAGLSGGTALRVRTADSIAMGPNAVEIGLNNIFGSGQTATLRFQARWLRGSTEPLLRFWGNYLEAAGEMTVPDNLGTPGLPNSQALSNNGPAIQLVRHDPAVPAANEPVVVTAHVADPDGVTSLIVRYRLDPSNTTSDVSMNDSGINGDAIAGDGVYSASLPGRASGGIAFTVIATDSQGASARFPELVDDNAPDRECVVWFGEPEPSNEFGTYHMWLTQANVDRWNSLPKMSNEDIDGTLVYNNRVIYNMGGRFSGSPWHSPSYDSPDGNKASHYVWTLPKDDQMLGYSSFNKIHWPGNDIQSGTVSNQQDDPTMQREQAANMFLRELGVPWMNRRLVAVYVNGTRRGKLMEDALRPTGSGLRKQYFSEDPDGQLYKVQRWYNGQSTSLIGEGRLQKYTTTDGAYKAARYRPVWALKTSPGSLSDFENLYTLITAANAHQFSEYDEFIENVVDVENWMRVSAANHVAGNWDCFGVSSGQNASAWVGPQTRWTLFTIDFGICLDQNLANAGLFGFGDNAWSQMFAKPKFQRMYYRALNELANGVMRSEVINPVMDAKYDAMTAAGYAPAAPTTTKNWIAARRSLIISTLSDVNSTTFSLDSNSHVTSNNSVTLTGDAPVEAIEISIDGVKHVPTWTGLTTWSLTLPVPNGNHNWSVAAHDRNGDSVGGMVQVSVDNSAFPESPVGNVVFNEIMADAAVPDAEYIELFNRSATTAFDLSGWTVNGLSYRFPVGSIIQPQDYLVLAKSSIEFSSRYGALLPVFDNFDGNLQSNGETLTLIQPGASPEEDVVVDQVRYESTTPWPVPPSAFSGVALQLIDASRDNSRSANWAFDNSVTGDPPPSITDLMPLDTEWRYHQTSGLDEEDWTAPDYDDSSWPEGAGLLGFESNLAITPLINTTLADPNNRSGAAVYFRTELNVPQDLTGYEIIATGYIDDGAIIHINGNAIIPRIRMPYTRVISTTLATDLPDGGDADPPDIFSIPTSAFVVGENTFAVQVHQRTTGSSDIVFGLKLDAEYVGFDTKATPGVANSVTDTLPEFPTLWINEVQAENLTGPGDDAGEKEPWVELYNPGNEVVDLSGFYLSADYSNPTAWAFPGAASIAPGEFLVVWLDGEPQETAGSSYHTSFRLDPADGRIALSRLVSGEPQILDYLNFPALSANYSYGDFPDGQPFYREAMYHPTPGGMNNAVEAPVSVSINEWMADNMGFIANPSTSQFEDWFELHNQEAEPADLSGYYLSDSLSDPFQYQIPIGYAVPAHGFLIVWADDNVAANNAGNPSLHVPFKLSKSGEAIGLFAPDGTPVNVVEFAGQMTDISEGRYPNAGGLRLFMPEPTPGAPNILPPLSGDPSFSQAIQLSDGSFKLTLPTEPGHTYRVEFKSDLNHLPWTALGGDHFATGPVIIVVDPAGDPERFYRIRVVE